MIMKIQTTCFIYIWKYIEGMYAKLKLVEKTKGGGKEGKEGSK
jgi:hypothetical protein